MLFLRRIKNTPETNEEKRLTKNKVSTEVEDVKNNWIEILEVNSRMDVGIWDNQWPAR